MCRSKLVCFLPAWEPTLRLKFRKIRLDLAYTYKIEVKGTNSVAYYGYLIMI